MKGRKVIVGVTGGIAAYKAAELVRLLVKEGAVTRVAMTHHATKFITPLTLETLSGNRVVADMWGPETHPLDHITWGQDSDLIIIAPATANFIGKMAHGIGDDFLSTVVIAATARVLVCPVHEHPDVPQPGGAGESANPQSKRMRDHGAGVRRAGLPHRRPGTASGAGGHCGRSEDAPVQAGSFRAQDPCDGRRDSGASGPGAIHEQPVKRQDGVCSGQSSQHEGRQGHPGERAHGSQAAEGCGLESREDRRRNEASGSGRVPAVRCDHQGGGRARLETQGDGGAQDQEGTRGSNARTGGESGYPGRAGLQPGEQPVPAGRFCCGNAGSHGERSRETEEEESRS